LLCDVATVGLYIVESSIQGACVGQNLHTSTVKIIDTSAFPDDKLEPWVAGGDAVRIGECNPFELVYCFIKLFFLYPTCVLSNSKNVLFYTWRNLVKILNLFIMLNLIEVLTDEDMTSREKKSISFLLAVLWVVPFAATHYFTYRRNFWRVKGKITILVYGLIFQKFLEYDDMSRSRVSLESAVMVMTQEVDLAVNGGYCKAIDCCFNNIPKIIMLLCSLLYIQSSSGTSDPLIFIVYLCMPFFILAFVATRQKTSFQPDSSVYIYIFFF